MKTNLDKFEEEFINNSNNPKIAKHMLEGHREAILKDVEAIRKKHGIKYTASDWKDNKACRCMLEIKQLLNVGCEHEKVKTHGKEVGRYVCEKCGDIFYEMDKGRKE